VRRISIFHPLWLRLLELTAHLTRHSCQRLCTSRLAVPGSPVAAAVVTSSCDIDHDIDQRDGPP